MFFPDEIIFVPSQQCNLHCAHCYVPHNEQKQNTQKALEFLKDAADDGISRIGFSGGEPFLSPDFLYDIISAAVSEGFIFDRLMTNGIWWQTETQLEDILNKVYEAGFDGTIAISFDAFHNQPPEKIAQFINTAQKIWQVRDICALVCVRTSDSVPFFTDGQSANKRTAAMLHSLAEKLNTEAIFAASTDAFPTELRYKDKLHTFCDDGTLTDEINISFIDYIPQDAADEAFWQAHTWFQEDFCAGPGNVYYIHADGSVAACCGYANDYPELILGNINTDTFAQIKEAGLQSETSGFLKTVYTTGLLKEATRREKAGEVFPGCGKTHDNCLFCRYLLTAKQ